MPQKQYRHRSYEDECQFIKRKNKFMFTISKGFVPNMNVEGRFYVNSKLEKIVFQELADHVRRGGDAGVGFLPAVKQISNVAGLPGIVHGSIAMPDVHAGYGFAIGNVAACQSINLSFVLLCFSKNFPEIS